ncbi:DUF2834 domain-containing protein [Ottowia testudinis]|uniref:DUF2834 domain-containing protein n=1 Tax=Ottowia testudinis TaxID=2816950 RepID=A0A975CE22_9BURK|nr:DUF2834 domain-containing protein [Ottowia testudinis]QTD44530.1 DUF2834 domain-containing protein [Ottowia testudinis]
MNISRSTALAWGYRALALVGGVATWHFNLRYFNAGGSVAPEVFWRAAFANPLTTAMTLDVYVSAIAFAVWVLCEGRPMPHGRRWLMVFVCFGLGLAVALPWYLAHRTRVSGAHKEWHVEP